MTDKLTVHVVDDDDAVRSSLEFLLKSARFQVRTYSSAADFLKDAEHLQPGCVITDVRMPGMSGIELLKQIKKWPNPMPVIVITGHGDVPLAVEAMKHGALEFLEKPFNDAILLKTVKTALTHQEKDEKQDSERTSVIDKLAGLSNRERQVLEGLVAGKPNKMIAFDLNISPRTVEIYRANVMTKLAADSLSHLVRMALLASVIPSER
jgi:two-component system response regulator FixJ